MATKCVGYQLKAGTFEKDGRTIDFDNVILHLTTDFMPDMVGTAVTTVKVKREKLKDLLKNDLSLDNILEQDEIQLCYTPINGTPVLTAIL